MLLRDEQVQAIIARADRRIEENAIMDGQAVVDALANIAGQDALDLLKQDPDGRWRYKRPNELTKLQRAAIKSVRKRDVIERVANDDGQKVDKLIRQEFTYVLHDKVNALELLGQRYKVLGKDEDPKAPGGMDLRRIGEMPYEKVMELQRMLRDAIEGEYEVTGETVDGDKDTKVLGHD